MSRVLKYRLNDGSLITRSGTESPFTISPLGANPTKVEVVVEDKGANSPLSNAVFGTPEETTLSPLPPTITSFSGSSDDGITISFSVPEGGFSYDDLQVRLRTTSGHPDVPLSALPESRVNLERIDGKIIGGTFTLIQGDGAGLGAVNTPGEYTISGGYEFYAGTIIRVRLRGVISGNNTSRTDVDVNIEGEVSPPPYVTISSRKTWQSSRPGSGNWFDIYANAVGFIKVGNMYQFHYERREYGLKVDQDPENQSEIQYHEYIESETPTDPESWSSPQTKTYNFPAGVEFRRSSGANNFEFEGGLNVIIPDPTTPGRYVALAQVRVNGNYNAAGKFTSTDGKEWNYVGEAASGIELDGALSLMYDPAEGGRWVMYNRARGNGSSAVGNWNHAGMPSGNIDGNRIGSSLRYTDRRGVTKIQSNTPNFTNSTLWQPATDGIEGTYLILDPSDVFNYETNNNPSGLETNTANLNNYPLNLASRLRYNESVTTNKELFDFYEGTAFYDEERQEYRMFFIVNHRTDKRWGLRPPPSNGYPSNFNFTNDMFQQTAGATRLTTASAWRPAGPWFPVELTSQDGTNFTFKNPVREEDGLMPSAFNITHIRRGLVPPAPYTQTVMPTGWSPTVNPEPFMLTMASTFLEYDGKKYAAVADSGRAYQFIPTRRNGTEANPIIESLLHIVEVDSSPGPDPDPDPELPQPTITSIVPGNNSLTVNGTTNIENITLLDPTINNISAHVEDGITVDFSVPQGGDGYDSLEVRLYNTSGFPDISIGTLPPDRVHVNTSNGRIVSGTFTILQGDGAGEGTTNSPGQYTVSGGYDFTVGDSFNVRIRGEINGQYTDRTTEQVTVGGQAVPTTPQNFRVTSTTESSISLAWNSVANADSYELFRNGTYLIQTTSTSHIDSGLASSTSFNYTVRAINFVGESPMSNQITGNTQQEGSPPEPGDWPLYTETINEPLSWDVVNEVEMTDHAGFAGVKAIGTGNHPSSNPNDWTLFKDGDPEYDCLDLVNPYMLTSRPNTSLPSRNEFPRFWKIKGGVGALWSGSYDSSSQPTGVCGRAARTKIIGEVWGHPHNQLRRVINKSLPWAGDHRRMVPTLHWDPVNKRYVSFFGERKSGGTWEGLRCISSCWTTTPHERESWIYKEDRPLLTHPEVRALYPELMQPQVVGNNWNWARMYPEFSFYYEGKHYLYFNAGIWTRNDSGDYENIDMILATTDYTDHTKWERVDQMDWNLIRKRRSTTPDGETHPDTGNVGLFWDRNGSWTRGLNSLTYYDGFYYTTTNALAGLNGGRGIAIYKATTPFGPWQTHGTGNVPHIETPYNVGAHSKSNLILYRDVWFLFGSIRDDGRDPGTSPLSEKYIDANVDRAYRVIFGGYYDPYGKINDILNSG